MPVCRKSAYWSVAKVQQTIFDFVMNYGYIALYVLLAAGIVGLPIPDETLLTFAGSLTASGGPWSLTPALFVAYGGTMTGMCVSYGVGYKVGKPFLYRYGKWIKLTPHRIQRAEGWFHKYGLWAVFFGYFVPGVRHFTCYLAGVSGVKLWKYLLFAGSGAFIWCVTFLALGHFIGENIGELLHVIHKYFGISLLVLVVLVLLGVFLYLKFRKKSAP
jgi:membrane protein DedA with SNARE-associated domain